MFRVASQSKGLPKTIFAQSKFFGKTCFFLFIAKLPDILHNQMKLIFYISV